MIKCKNCWEKIERSWFYTLNTLSWSYLVQPCKVCRKEYSSEQYKQKVSLKNNIKNNEK